MVGGRNEFVMYRTVIQWSVLSVVQSYYSYWAMTTVTFYWSNAYGSVYRGKCCDMMMYIFIYTQSFSIFISISFIRFPLVQVLQRSAPLWWSEMVRQDPHLFRDTKIRTSCVFRKDPHLWHVGILVSYLLVAEQASKDPYN